MSLAKHGRAVEFAEGLAAQDVEPNEKPNMRLDG